MKLEKLVSKFRKAIDKAFECGELDNHITLRSFPKGCCGLVSDMLAEYLLENNIRTKYILGNWYGETSFDTQSHAWLSFDNLIIDITGDQFKNNPTFLNYNQSIYVGRGNEFYDLFLEQDRMIYSAIGLYKTQRSNELVDIYNRIKTYL